MENKKTILVVEDDTDLAEIINIRLQKNNYDVVSAISGAQALECIATNNIDLILLDIMLPDVDGTNLCLQIRKRIYCPIIFISAIDEQDYILKAFKNGGDDYVTKPINYPQLFARIEANLRRSKQYAELENKAKSFNFGDFELKFSERVLLKKNEPLFLSPTQISLLIYLIENRDTAVSYESIYNDVLHQSSNGDVRTLQVHMYNLRSWLDNIDCIVTVKNFGYKFDTSKI
jgi:DNA-binding response OmpR family regulator